MQHKSLRLKQVGLLDSDLPTPGQEVRGVVSGEERTGRGSSFKRHLPGKQLVECRRTALGDLRLQRSDQITQLHTVVQLLHKKLRSHMFPQHRGEPDGQVLLHGEQGGLVSNGKPLVVLKDVCQTRTMSLGQRTARALGTQQRSDKLLTKTHLDAGLDSHDWIQTGFTSSFRAPCVAMVVRENS